MRVMTANAHSGGYYSSPKWLFDAGCKGFEYNAGGDDPTIGGRPIPRIEPDYADPIYLAKHRSDDGGTRPARLLYHQAGD
jgi:hypothetical protein